ncbi:MAG TPA: hypothetical protein VIM96_11450 [Pseudomonadales bacterium]
MSEPLFDLYFSGQCIPNAPLDAVKKNMGLVFKADAAKIDALFNGQTHCIKKGLDQAAAQKYEAILRKAGAIIELKPQAPSKQSMAERLAGIDTTTLPEKPAKTASAATSADDALPEYSLTVAAAGSPLLHPAERAAKTPPAKPIEAPAFETLAQYSRLSEETPPPPPAPDTGNLSTSTEYERLSDEQPPAPPAPDTGFLSIAEVGSRIGPELAEFAALELPEIETMELSPPGADLLSADERRSPAAPPAPDTSHLTLNNS